MVYIQKGEFMTLSKYIGSIFILIGAAIGAGMLALPMVGAAAGFWYSTILLVVIWAIMTTTALLTLETCLAFEPYRNSFGTMAKSTLGTTGQVAAWLAYLLLLYATTASYIDGSTSLIGELLLSFFDIHLPASLNAILFMLVFGGMVFWSMRTVDYFIRFLLSAGGILLLIMLFLLMPYVDISKLIMQPHNVKYLWAAAPIFLNAFGFHFVIPSICTYCDKKVVPIRRIIIISTTIPLIVYTLWLLVSLGIVPISGTQSFSEIVHNKTSVGGFVGALGHIAGKKYILYIVNAFSNIAIITSFLGIALGLFDFLADGFKRNNKISGRLQTALLAFSPPLAIALFFPDAFIIALEYSTFFAIILEIFLPGLMVYKLRKSKTLSSPYRFNVNSSFLRVLFILIGIILMGIIIADRLHLLPVLFKS